MDNVTDQTPGNNTAQTSSGSGSDPKRRDILLRSLKTAAYIAPVTLVTLSMRAQASS